MSSRFSPFQSLVLMLSGVFAGCGTFGMMRPDSSSPAKARAQGSQPKARIGCHNEEL